MKYSLDIYVVSNNAGTITAAKNLIPSKSSPGVYLLGCQDLVDGIDDDGDRFIRAVIQYEPTHKANRDNAFTNLKGLNGLFNNCIDGYVRKHICHNNSDPLQPCTKEEVYRK